jgi:hypothetical protein
MLLPASAHGFFSESTADFKIEIGGARPSSTLRKSSKRRAARSATTTVNASDVFSDDCVASLMRGVRKVREDARFYAAARSALFLR